MGFSSVDAYLSRLPQGLASYPDTCCKGMVWQQFVGGTELSAELERQLPAELSALLKRPPSSTAWVPEVHLIATVLALCEHQKISDDAYVEQAYVLNCKLLAQPLARLLLLVISPTHLRDNISERWGRFHKGTVVTSEPVSPTAGSLTFRFPPHLVPSMLQRCYGTGFRAAIEGAGGKHVLCELTAGSDSHAIYHLKWTR